MRPSSLGGGAYCVALCLSVRPSRYRSFRQPLASRMYSSASVTSRHLANYNDTDVLFGTHWGPHIVRPSRPHKFLLFRRFISHRCHHGKSHFTLLSSANDPRPYAGDCPCNYRKQFELCILLCPRPYGRDIKRWCASDVCLVWRLSVYLSLTSGLSRGLARKTKIGTEVADVTRDSDTTFKVKRSKG